MTVENATYIDGLDATLPASGDSPTEGDNHLRLIKAVLKATFPNINGPITLTDEEINAGGGGGGGGGGTPTDGAVPVGGIIVWSGLESAIPAGWALCNGSNYTPDLRDRFVMGSGTGSISWPGLIGGSAGHAHTGAVGATTLSLAQIPAHNHGGGDHRHGIILHGDGSAPGQLLDCPPEQCYQAEEKYTQFSGAILTTQGGGESHTHTISTTDSLPPYYALCYIMRIS